MFYTMWSNIVNMDDVFLIEISPQSIIDRVMCLWFLFNNMSFEGMQLVLICNSPHY